MILDSNESTTNSNKCYSMFDSLNRAEYYLMSNNKNELSQEEIGELLDNIKKEWENAYVHLNLLH